jgi:hypothetical protein
MLASASAMNTTIYEVACYMDGDDFDGRTTAGLWGHEHQFHATHELAEAAVHRLRKRAAAEKDSVRYEVEARVRADFPSDPIGDQEWKRACRQAGVDAVTGKILSAK